MDRPLTPSPGKQNALALFRFRPGRLILSELAWLWFACAVAEVGIPQFGAAALAQDHLVHAVTPLPGAQPLPPRSSAAVNRTVDRQVSDQPIRPHFSVLHSTHFDHVRLFDRTVLVQALDDDPLTASVLIHLTNQLRSQGRFASVLTVPSSSRIPSGTRLPELYLMLQRAPDEPAERFLNQPPVRGMLVTASDTFGPPTRRHTAQNSPPRFQFLWRSQWDLNSPRGADSPLPQQELAARLAERIGSEFLASLDSLKEKSGPPPELPEQFFPAYVEPPQFDFLNALRAEKLLDGSRLLEPTVAVWRVSGGRWPVAPLDLIEQSLIAAGWKVPSGHRAPHSLQATNGDETLEAFFDDGGTTDPAADENASVPLYIHFVRRVSRDALWSALQALLKQPDSEETLLLFPTEWRRHRAEIEQYFSDNPPQTSRGWRQLAALRQKSDPAAAKTALLYAYELHQIFHPVTPNEAILKLGRELGIEQWPSRVSPELIELLGVQKLVEPGEVLTTVPRGQTGLVLLDESAEAQTWLLITPLRDSSHEARQILQSQLTTLHNRASTTATLVAKSAEGADRWENIQRLPTGDRLRIASTVNDDGHSFQIDVHSFQIDVHSFQIIVRRETPRE